MYYSVIHIKVSEGGSGDYSPWKKLVLEEKKDGSDRAWVLTVHRRGQAGAGPHRGRGNDFQLEVLL